MGKPSNKEFREIFNVAASQYDAGTNSYALARRIEFVTTHARGACLEVGAGTGEISRALAGVHAVTATDIAPGMVEEIKRKMNIPALVCDAEELPFPDASFDTVVCGEVVYYLDRPERFIAEAKRVLRPNGLLLITFASSMTTFYDRIRTLLRVLGFGSMYFDDRMHTYPSTTYIGNIIRASGFHLKEVQRLVVVPVRSLDFLNRILEKTPLKHAAAFTACMAVKA